MDRGIAADCARANVNARRANVNAGSAL